MPRAARADGQRNQQAARRLHRDGDARQCSMPKLALPAGDPHRLLLNREGEQAPQCILKESDDDHDSGDCLQFPMDALQVYTLVEGFCQHSDRRCQHAGHGVVYFHAAAECESWEANTSICAFLSTFSTWTPYFLPILTRCCSCCFCCCCWVCCCCCCCCLGRCARASAM